MAYNSSTFVTLNIFKPRHWCIGISVSHAKGVEHYVLLQHVFDPKHFQNHVIGVSEQVLLAPTGWSITFFSLF